MKQPKKPLSELQHEPTMPITKAELLRLQDIARGLEVLQTIAKRADDVSLAQVEWVIDKITDPLWTLTHDDLESRWIKCNPDVELFGKGGAE
jgi:hypothetical protein